MTTPGFTVLVVAKAPVPGLAKTRLCPPLTHAGAADVAAAALLDTLALAETTVDGDRSRIVVSFAGCFADAARTDELARAMAGCHLSEQVGATFGQRLSHAHQDAAAFGGGLPVVQIGMDTPHADPDHLVDAAHRVSDSRRSAVIGEATDGGWWLLALSDPAVARVLIDVPMSHPDTAQLTRESLLKTGLSLGYVPALNDVDTWDDAAAVAASHPATFFAEAVRRHRLGFGASA